MSQQKKEKEYKELYNQLIIGFLSILLIPILCIVLIVTDSSTQNVNIQRYIIIGIFIISAVVFKVFFKASDIIMSKYINISDNYKKVNKEKNEYQNKYLRTEKLITMGRFASGIAHEIGNPLSSIISSVEILKTYELSEDEKYDYFNKISNDSEKIDRLLSEFLDFRKHEEKSKTKTDINKIILESIENVSDDKKRDEIEIVMDFSKSIPNLNVDKERIKIVFTNIIQNAYQAIDGEGFIHIRTLLVNNGVRIRISDTGTGIKPEDIKNIFDPFFTTKDVGNGFGLGLFICSQIVHSHSGTIKVDSNLGQGTTFTIELGI
ncbi:ATP-binding protein [Clostridiaceae bacterium HSG29]|nr:ATP-binding protein [Clostridiaceae bacterium HSG29]